MEHPPEYTFKPFKEVAYFTKSTMVKMKKAALGAIGMASLKALDIGAGEEAISVKVEVSKYHKNKYEVQCNAF